MKFSHVLVNLIAAVAQPQLELAHLVEEAGQPEQRADASFTVYVNGGTLTRPGSAKQVVTKIESFTGENSPF
ncbi:hypothetical protein CHU98_g2819 [Xylaria longipes]|nr:hypothetical protein CHU98_g2819 [Xylaria longipes]